MTALHSIARDLHAAGATFDIVAKKSDAVSANCNPKPCTFNRFSMNLNRATMNILLQGINAQQASLIGRQRTMSDHNRCRALATVPSAAGIRPSADASQP